jgi:predicted nucleic acid binding AN1-type Zn finger protein
MKCFVCKKNVGLLGFQCKCDKDKHFCATHRYAEQHNCTFDYKKEQRDKITKENPIIDASKIIKI